MDTHVETSPEQPEETPFSVLIERARKGDCTALPQIREYLDANPYVWEHLGDVSLSAQAAWMRLIAGPDVVRKEALARRVNELKASLAGEASSPIERLLVERSVTTWLQLAYHDARSAQRDEKDIRWAQFELKRLNSANDRHLKSLLAMATVRRLMPRVVEIRPPASEPEQVPATCAVNHPPAAGKPRRCRKKAKTNGHSNGHTNGHTHRLTEFFTVAETTDNG